MRHWYVVFPNGVSPTAARRMLKRWGAKAESDQPPIPLDGGDITIAVKGPADLPERAKDAPGVGVFDNQTHQELY
jgi:hypothetical protein